jgi:hypothetical protein
METFNKAVVLLLLFTMISSVCFAAPKKKLDPLDAAIRETSDYLNSNVAKGSKIVILNIQSDSGALSEYIIDELISNAVNDRVFLVVDRQQLDAIRTEQNFQFSGEVDDKQALEIGKFFGAQTIVSGAMGSYGKDYRLRVRALEVQTALVQGQFNKNITKSTAIPILLASKPSGTTTTTTASTRTTTTTASSSSSKNPTITIVNNTGMDHIRVFYFSSKFLTQNGSDIKDFDIGGIIRNGESKTLPLPRLTANTQYSVGMVDIAGNNSNLFRKDNLIITAGMTITLTSEDQRRVTAQAYNVGDTGPAGGLIFYDKGNNSGGWRYLEAAPVEAEFQAIFSIHNSSYQSLFSAAPYGTTESSIGSGKRNTKSIFDKSKEITGEWDTAVQKCVELNFRGFNDWFLPSIDELNQMYGNLKRRNLDEFRNDFYWSSTDIGIIHDGNQGVRVLNFGDGGRISNAGRSNKYIVRPIRQVAGPAN